MKRVSKTPQPPTKVAQNDPAIHTASRVKSARESIKALPLVMNTLVSTDNPCNNSGLLKLLAICATGMDMKSAVAVQPLHSLHLLGSASAREAKTSAKMASSDGSHPSAGVNAFDMICGVAMMPMIPKAAWYSSHIFCPRSPWA